MVRVRHSIVVKAPVAKVFDYISDPANAKEWVTGVAQSERIGSGAMRAGMRGRQVRHFLGQEVTGEYEITAFEPNRRVEFTVSDGPLAGGRVAELVEQVAGAAVESTRVTYVFDGEPRGLWRALRIAEPVATKLFQRQLRSDFATLKDILESR
jgi:uncharacterized protein YndB with AHSA1/START domain